MNLPPDIANSLKDLPIRFPKDTICQWSFREVVRLRPELNWYQEISYAEKRDMILKHRQMLVRHEGRDYVGRKKAFTEILRPIDPIHEPFLKYYGLIIYLPKGARRVLLRRGFTSVLKRLRWDLTNVTIKTHPDVDGKVVFGWQVKQMNL